MIHHLILMNESADLRIRDGILYNGENKIALQVLGSLQCLASHARWSQALQHCAAVPRGHGQVEHRHG